MGTFLENGCFIYKAVSLIGQTSERMNDSNFLGRQGAFSYVRESSAQISPYSGMGLVRAVEATEPPFVPEPCRTFAVRADRPPVFPASPGRESLVQSLGQKSRRADF